MSERSTVILRVLEGAPLADERIGSTVEATARAIAERTGVELLDVHIEADRVMLVIMGDRIAAVGLAAELRRLTEKWYRDKYGAWQTLWGEHEH